MPDFKFGANYIHRLCAVPGDILEMKNGILYVNDHNFDQSLNLNNQYKITSAEFYLIEESDINDLEASDAAQMISKDSVLIIFDSALINKYEDSIKPLPFIVTGNMFECFKWNGKNLSWTVDNFGPLKIPAGCYFVLGDNRHNALDSRYIGFVKKENIKGVALNK
jgi:signal peptidase I